ncbi:type I restriction-modification system [Vibrio sp. JCM 19236]|nr:type I restriction-modification system [Vibrio sp. JCM 19236]
MGYVFEELIRKFNEENNEEAGEHFTPREVIELMTHLVFDPIQSDLPLTITAYDPACGSGGMLTEAENFILEKYPTEGVSRDIHLFGKEVNDETYAICKSDMMIKGKNPENIKVGSTLEVDEFADKRFDFCLSNPPYGKSWSTDQKYIKDGSDVIDPRFIVELEDYWGTSSSVDATPRSSDGQLLFLMEMISKMKPTADSPLGSRIASIHNGSSLFTGDAGSGESNIRRYIIENDMLDAIVQLPNNLFYNTGITTYVWLLSNNKSKDRKGKVQLIDASLLFKKLRKNLGNKNCEFAPEHIQEITQTYLDATGVERQLDDNNDPVGLAAKVFDNADFGYYKVNIERPDRRSAQLKPELIEPMRFEKSLREIMEHIYEEHGDAVYQAGYLKANEKSILDWCEENDISLNAKAKTKLFNQGTWDVGHLLVELANQLSETIAAEYNDFNQFKADVEVEFKKLAPVLLDAYPKGKRKAFFTAVVNAVSWYDETAEKVIKKVVKFKQEKFDELLHHLGCEESDLADFGYYAINGKKLEFTTYEANTDLRDAESVPLTYIQDKDTDNSEVHQYFLDEVKPFVDEAWVNLDSTKIGYEISFNRYFYQHKQLRSINEVATDIISLEQKAEGLIADILGINLVELKGS